jgi:hypothetical protein
VNTVGRHLVRYSPARLLAQVSTTGASVKIGAVALGSPLSGAPNRRTHDDHGPRPYT